MYIIFSKKKNHKKENLLFKAGWHFVKVFDKNFFAFFNFYYHLKKFLSKTLGLTLTKYLRVELWIACLSFIFLFLVFLIVFLYKQLLFYFNCGLQDWDKQVKQP